MTSYKRTIELQHWHGTEPALYIRRKRTNALVVMVAIRKSRWNITIR